MPVSLTSLRRAFFAEVAAQAVPFPGRLVLLTHLVDDRPELLEALATLAPIALVIGKDYSVDKPTREKLASSYRVVVSRADELDDLERLIALVVDAVPTGPFLVAEIGGYFADDTGLLERTFGSRLRGIVEDTEFGERRYRRADAAGGLAYPVVSVARSVLKDPEDALVGESCVFSAERLLRSAGYTLNGRRCVVIGYGKVGRGAARSLLGRGCPTVVVEDDPVRRILARAEGFQTPELEHVLPEAEIIWGATGTTSLAPEHVDALSDATVLVSMSSGRVEFAVNHLDQSYEAAAEAPALTRYERDGRRVFLAAGGEPVNFLDNAVIGPVLALVQAEIIVALGLLSSSLLPPGLQTVEAQPRAELARRWLAHFLDASGCYRW